MLKRILKKIIPHQVFLIYHWLLACLAGFIYGYPSRKMIVIGVTGTSGKSTAVNLIGQILEQAGFKVGLATTFNFKIGKKEWINKEKMTMLGRFALQRLLKKMSRSGCHYAVIETTSQGVKQYRHLGISYDVGVFTNLAPEHIESHGSFEKYREAKQNFFQHLGKRKKKRIGNKLIDKVSVVNLDDENREYFLKFKLDGQYGYGISFKPKSLNNKQIELIKAELIRLNSNGSEFTVQGVKFTLNLLGKFNVYNALTAISVGLSQGINLETCKKALMEIKQIPGRMEIIIKEPFMVVVDYAHTPDSLEKVYKSLKDLNDQAKLICVLGAAGGGRDKWKRPVMGEVAEKYCDEIIVTNEDPYDEDPEEIVNQIISGVKNKKAARIIDRKKAIQNALETAGKGDIVVVTGKGCEPWIMGSKGEKIAWDDRKIVKDFLNEEQRGVD